MIFPKISVVTPNLNQGQFLERTIISVISQNYPNLEYIIIDGGSTDCSLEIIKKYATSISYYITEKDRGLYDALNKGFKKSSGEIMLYINSDDVLLPHSLFNIASIFSDFEEIDWVTGINSFIDEKDRIVEIKRAKSFSKYDFLLRNYKWIQQESTCWRRSLWEDAGGYIDAEYKFAGDFELWFRFIEFNKLYFFNTTIGAFRIRKNQLSSTHILSYEDEVEKVLLNLEIKTTKKEKLTLINLKILILLKTVIKFSVLFDIYLFRKIIAKRIHKLHGYADYVEIDANTLKLKKGKIGPIS